MTHISWYFYCKITPNEISFCSHPQFLIDWLQWRFACDTTRQLWCRGMCTICSDIIDRHGVTEERNFHRINVMECSVRWMNILLLKHRLIWRSNNHVWNLSYKKLEPRKCVCFASSKCSSLAVMTHWLFIKSNHRMVCCSSEKKCIYKRMSLENQYSVLGLDWGDNWLVTSYALMSHSRSVILQQCYNVTRLLPVSCGNQPLNDWVILSKLFIMLFTISVIFFIWNWSNTMNV